jgi:hypothetical protein
MTDSGHYLRPSSGLRPTTTERMLSWGLRPPRGSAALRHEPPPHRLRRIVLRTTERETQSAPSCDFAKRSRSRKRCGGGLQREALGGRSPPETIPSVVVGRSARRGAEVVT